MNPLIGPVLRNPEFGDAIYLVSIFFGIAEMMWQGGVNAAF